MHHPRGEAGACRQRAQRALVGDVAGVHDPVAVGEVGHRQPAVPRRHPDSPLARPQRRDLVVVAPLRGREVVVVDEGQVDLVAREQVERLQRLVLQDPHVDPGVGGAEVVDRGEERGPDGRREAGDAQHADRLGSRVEVEACGLDGGEDRHRVVGEPSARRGQPDPSAVRLQEGRADVARQGRDALRDARRRRAEGVGDLVHRAEAGELEEHAEATDVHACIVLIR